MDFVFFRFSRAQVFETFKINFAVLQTGLLKNDHKKFIIWVFDVLENEIYDKTLCFWSDKRTNVRIWDVIYFNFAGSSKRCEKKIEICQLFILPTEKVYCKAVFNFENVSDLRGCLRPKKNLGQFIAREIWKDYFQSE